MCRLLIEWGFGRGTLYTYSVTLIHSHTIHTHNLHATHTHILYTLLCTLSSGPFQLYSHHWSLPHLDFLARFESRFQLTSCVALEHHLTSLNLHFLKCILHLGDCQYQPPRLTQSQFLNSLIMSPLSMIPQVPPTFSLLHESP